MTSARALPAAVVRLRDESGRIVGAGFLVAPDLVCTCAHVLGGESTPPQGLVSLDFPMLAGAPAREARVEVWLPVLADGRGDVALLRLVAPAPAGFATLALREVVEPWGRRFRVPGFPVGHEDGVWAGGILRERQGTGWVQMQVESTPLVAAGFSGAPVWSEDLGAVIGMTVAADNGSGTAYLIPSEALVAASADLAPPCPFPGLEPFRAEDARYFFGRDEEADLLIERLTVHRLVVVAGPSGCGKSSLVDAGLRPRLEAAGTTVAVSRPVPGQSARELVDSLGSSKSRESVLIVDQFEELIVSDVAAAREALRLLDALSASSGGPRIVLTLRASSLDDLLAEGEVPAVDGATMLLHPLRDDRLRQAVERPVAETPGVAYQEGLVDRIVADAHTGTGLLPLVGFTLTELWKAREAGLLTLRAYDHIGGVAGALAGHAERFTDGLSAPAQGSIRKLVTRLTRYTDDGFAMRPTRLDEVPDGQRPAVDMLLRARLLVVRDDQDKPAVLALAHETLIQTWEMLRTWLDTDRTFLAWHAEVRDLAERWERSGRDRSLILRGGRLAAAKEWIERRPHDVDQVGHDFVAAGTSHQRRISWAWRTAVAALVVLVLLAGLLAVRTSAINDELDTTLRKQAAQMLSDLAERESGISVMSALQFGLAAWRHDPDIGYGALLRQQAIFHDVAEIDHDRFPVPMDLVETTPTGDIAVSATSTGALTAWRDPWTDNPKSWPLGTVESIAAIRVSDKGTHVAVLDSSAAIRVWDLRARTEPILVRPPAAAEVLDPLRGSTMEISPSGNRVVLVNAASGTNRAEVWSVAEKPTGKEFAPPSANLLSIAAINDDGTAAFQESTSTGQEFGVRNLDTGVKLRSTPGMYNTVGQGRMALTCDDSVLTVRDVFTGAERYRQTSLLPTHCYPKTDLTGEFLVFESIADTGSFSLITLVDPRDGRIYQTSTPSTNLTAEQQRHNRTETVVLRTPGGAPDVLHVTGTAVVRSRPPRPVEDTHLKPIPLAYASGPNNPAFSGDGALMAVVARVGEPKGLSLIDTRTYRRTAYAPEVQPQGLQFLKFTPDKSRLLLFDGPYLVVLDTVDLTELHRVRLPVPAELDGQQEFSWPTSVAAMNEQTAVTLHAGLLVRWNLDTGSPVAPALPVGDTQRDRLTAAERGLVIGTPDPDVVLVNTTDGQQEWNLRTRTKGDHISPEPGATMLAAVWGGDRMVFQYASGRAYVHNFESGTTSRAIPLTAHRSPVGFSPDNRLVVQQEELVEVWDTTTARPLGSFRMPNETTHLSVLGSRLIGANKYGIVSIDLDTSRWHSELCAITNRNYRPDELDRLPTGADRTNPCSP